MKAADQRRPKFPKSRNWIFDTMKPKSPAFQFYPADWLADEKVSCLSIEEEGAYIRLLSYCWREGSIPADTESLCRLAKGCHADAIEKVKKLFAQHPSLPGRLESKRLNKEIVKQENYRKSQSASGLRGAEKRWGKNGDPIATPMAKDSSSSLSSSSPSGNNNNAPKQEQEAFELENLPEVTKSYHRDSRTVLHFLNEKAGKRYRELDCNLKLISQRLSEPGVDLVGVKVMINRQCSLWLGTDMEMYLRPETLFNKTKFESYFACREMPVGNSKPSQSQACIPQTISSAEMDRLQNERLIALGIPKERLQ